MRQDDWRPIDTAPLNPYGKAWGPIVLVWCTANEQPHAGAELVISEDELRAMKGEKV